MDIAQTVAVTLVRAAAGLAPDHPAGDAPQGPTLEQVLAGFNPAALTHFVLGVGVLVHEIVTGPERSPVAVAELFKAVGYLRLPLDPTAPAWLALGQSLELAARVQQPENAGGSS